MQRQRNLADFVQEKRALVGQFKQTAFLRPSVRECALFISEQFAFEQRLRNGGAIDREERLGLAQALVMQSFGDQILAGSILPFDQDRPRLTDRDATDKTENVAHSLGFGDNLTAGRLGFVGDVSRRRHHPRK